MNKFHITNFVRRQTPQSGFSHWEISDDEFLARLNRNFDKAKPGYREGVCLVPVEPEGFFSGIVQLKEGDILVGEYVARKSGEDPRKSSYSFEGQKIPAVSAWIVLYRHDVLAENNENETDAEWEVVSVNASPTEDEPPIPTGALIANHLQLSGGTSTKMSDAEFVALLRKSVEFWKDKALACPENLQQKVNNASSYKQIAENDQLLEVGRKAIEDELIEWRDSRLSSYTRNNGFVIKEKDGQNSDVIRFGPEVGLKIALKAIANKLIEKQS